MKKLKIAITVVSIITAFILLFSVKLPLKDASSVMYNAVLYQVRHRVNPTDKYRAGLKVEILGITVYDSTKIT